MQAVTLSRPLPKVLGMGAYLKAGLCLIVGDRALLTGDAGDLATLAAVERYDAMLDALLDRHGRPDCAAHDLHPDFHSTRAAESLGCATRAVQHHHAHIAATLAEHGADGPALGLALDGFGLGSDGGAWGGELVRVDAAGFTRLGHLAWLPQPGGDAAARAPWLMGAAALHHLGRTAEIGARFGRRPNAESVAEMLQKQVNAPMTSSCGRLFDAACGLLGVHPVAAFEGQAPMALEALADAPRAMPGGWVLGDGLILDFAPLLERLLSLDPRAGANLFHGTLAAGLAAWVGAARAQTGLDMVALGGGCFANAVLGRGLAAALADEGLTVLAPRAVPPGDAGISLGQAMVAALSLERKS